MERKIDDYSFALGVCAAFCETVRAGVKRIALSHPFTDADINNYLGESFTGRCAAIAGDYGCKAYYLEEGFVTDLFPVSLNKGKHNVVFYKDDNDIAELIDLIKMKAALLSQGKYRGEERLKIARSYGKLLSYSDEAIESYLASNNEKE